VKGEVVYFFAFDVANEFLMEEARRLLSERKLLADPGAPRSPRGMTLSPPLIVAVAQPPVALHGTPVTVEARLFEFGAISIVMRVPYEVDALAGLCPFLNPTLDDGRRLDDLARSLCEQVRGEVEAALVRPSAVAEPESYIVFCVRDLPDTDNAERWLADQKAEAARLLTSMAHDQISSSQIDEVFRYQRSLTRADAVVPAWDAALVVDLTGPPTEVLYTLELANLQLEEFRQMDRALDRFLTNAYADLERRTLVPGGTTVVLRKLRWFRIDVTRLADEVSNTTKIFGDWHLARVYIAARDRFHLDRWRQSVEQRLGQLDEVYNLVRAELWERRMFVLELFIAILILFEVFIAILWRSH